MPSALPPPWRRHEDDIKIDKTGQGDVFKVRRPVDDGTYALKRLKNPKRSARFQREVEAMKAMSETDIGIVPPVIDSNVDSKGHPYYVMPWYDNGSLETAVNDGRFTDPADAIRILLRLTDALEVLHSHEWAHRDLKPDNVLMDGDSLLLCDLGLALPVDLDGDEERLTETAEAVGSRYYIAPENESGFSDEVDQRPADFYAFGKISWRVLTGQRTLARELQLHQTNRTATMLNDDRLAAWDQVCDQLLNTDPRARLTDWVTVRTELANILNEITGTQDDPRPSPTRIEALTAAAERLSRSASANDLRGLHASRNEYHAKVDELRQAGFGSAGEAAQQLVDLNQLTGGLIQASVSDYSGHTVGSLLDVGALEGLPNLDQIEWDAVILPMTTAGTFKVERLIGPTCPSVHLAGYVLAKGDDVWMLRVPFIWASGPRLLPTLTARFRNLSGPYRLGLASAKSAARTLGTEVVNVGVTIAEEFINLLAQGRPIDDPQSWVTNEPS